MNDRFALSIKISSVDGTLSSVFPASPFAMNFSLLNTISGIS
jgi:hypothetical protein